jgi:outer membrane receptor for ferrienterochelin and colicins
MKNIALLFLFVFSTGAYTQEKITISGIISSENHGILGANIVLLGTSYTTATDSVGYYKLQDIPQGSYKIQATANTFQTARKTVTVKENENTTADFTLSNTENQLNEVVISGTLKPVRRLESPVPVEVYTPVFF